MKFKASQGIPGVKNITDDIIVYGPTQAIHDQTLREVFQHLRKKGLTLIQSKCAFNKPNLDFFGYTFSAAGASPDSNKVSAIQNAATPQTASEVHSFLRLTNHVTIQQSQNHSDNAPNLESHSYSQLRPNKPTVY